MVIEALTIAATKLLKTRFCTEYIFLKAHPVQIAIRYSKKNKIQSPNTFIIFDFSNHIYK